MEDQEMFEVNLALNERTQLRRIFTIAANKVEKIINEEQVNMELLEEEFAKFTDKAERLFSNDNKVSGLILNSEDYNEEARIVEFDKTEEYRDRWISLDRKRNKLVSNNQDVRSQGSGNKKHNLKLFKLIPKKFKGEAKDWIRFWAMFRKIHEDDSLDLEEKFQYLIQCTEEDSPARELLDCFPPSAGNYQKAIDQLKCRFGQDDVLKELYIRELLSLVLIQAKGEREHSLKKLYDSLLTQLRSLETLGVTAERFAFILSPLVESALPHPVLIQWERERSNYVKETEEKNNDEGQANFNGLLAFLKKEVDAEGRVQLARNAFSSDVIEGISNCKISGVKSSVSGKSKKVPTAAALVNLKPTKPQSCIFCEGAHLSGDCFKVRERSMAEIETILKEKGACFVCLKKGHNRKKCSVPMKCIICNGRHVPLLCSQRKTIGRKDEPTVELNLSNINYNSVLLQTILVKVRGNSEQMVRLLIDTGSQRSYVTKRLAKMMNLVPLREEKLSHVLFGGAQTGVVNHICYRVRISSVTNDFHCNFEALECDTVCHSLPVTAKGPWFEELKKKGIILSDEREGPIDILVGGDIAGKLMVGRKETLSNGLVALETVLGWTVMGRVSGKNIDCKTHINLVTAEMEVQDLWRLDILGIEDPIQSKDQETIVALEHFTENVTIQDGRYEVSLPWLAGHPPLPRNWDMAKRRLENTVKKLKVSNRIGEYGNTFQEWLQNNIIEEVPGECWDVGHYLPHRPVFKESGTTRIRPVFDASARSTGNPSLNQCLVKGVNLIEVIPKIILRFRLGKVGVVADIEKAFLQISLREIDRDCLRFLWQNEEGNIIIFRHRRVVFGISSSPFLLGAVINHHLDKCKQNAEREETGYTVKTIERLKCAFYVDNCVTSLPSEKELHNFIGEAVAVFKEAKFNLRGWEYTDPNCPGPIETPVLGLIWNKKKDALRLNVPNCLVKKDSPLTRRILLSNAQKLFDVIGVSCPTSLMPKLLIQETWVEEGGWDTEVNESTKRKFRKWLEEIPLLEQLEIPRWVMYNQEEAVSSLHVFCDASQKAYATACFLRVEYPEDVRVYLLQAKSRVAPIKRITIPRLELLAATIGARLASGLLEELLITEVYYWTDSTTVLAWIEREEPWGVYVWNRVQEIRKLSNPKSWRHVPGVLNPADLVSRGCSPKALIQSKWWEGPSWLRLSEESWPSVYVESNEEEINHERKKSAVVLLDSVAENNRFYEYFSSFSKIERMIAWMRRFIYNTRSPSNRLSGELSTHEVEEAEYILLRMVQRESFTDRKNLKLSLLQDEHGILRVRTQIVQREDKEDFRYPILLPSSHTVVRRLIEEFHLKNCHAAGQTLLCLLRERYWILKGRKTIRSVTSKCVVCRRQEAKKLSCSPSALPIDRVRDAAAFEVVGIDFAGPLLLKEENKAWICLYTCAIYRAVHFELVTSLSTEAFLQTFRRFIARRGRPSVIYSDNGTNFKGACNAFNKLNWAEIESYSSARKIKWIFSPPTAAWWGGWWERLVGVLKKSLRKVLSRSSLKYEEMATILCDAEALINSRPLTHVSNKPEDLLPLTPAMFIQDLRDWGVPECDKIDSERLNKRLVYRQKLREDLRRRFRSEYLGLLKGDSRQSKKQAFGVGDIVLIESEGKRIDWPLAKIIRLIPGKDGEVRLVSLKTRTGEVLRPIQRLYPLEITALEEKGEEEAAEDSKSSVKEDVVNYKEDDMKDCNNSNFLRSQLLKSGRQTRPPRKLLD